MFCEMKHGLPPLINANSTVLVLGTMPGERSIALQQYYANKGNRFWKILFTVFKEPFSHDYEDRKNLLHRHGIALWNVLQSCEREGSSDSAILNEKPNNLDALHTEYPNIRHVFFESKGAEAYFIKYNKKRAFVSYAVLPSTSGLNARLSFQEKLEQWAALANMAQKSNPAAL
jgi:hypoxanthine-DNA glycosylase